MYVRVWIRLSAQKLNSTFFKKDTEKTNEKWISEIFSTMCISWGVGLGILFRKVFGFWALEDIYN